MNELRAFLKRSDAHSLAMLPELNEHLRRVALALVPEMTPVPRRNRERHVREWLAQNLDGLLSAEDRDEMAAHILVAVGRRAPKKGTLGYVGPDCYWVHGWHGCPRFHSPRFRVTDEDDPNLLSGRKCRYCWMEKDQRRLDAAKARLHARHGLATGPRCPECGSDDVDTERAYRSPWVTVACNGCGEISEVDAAPRNEAAIQY